MHWESESGTLASVACALTFRSLEGEREKDRSSPGEAAVEQPTDDGEP